MRTLMTFAVVAHLAGCVSSSGASLEIEFAPAPTDACEFEPDATQIMSRGAFDPSGLQSQFLFAMQLKNNLPLAVSRPARVDGQEFRNQTNDVVLNGFESCWYRADDPRLDGVEPFGDGPPLNCDDLGETQRGFLPSAGGIDEDGGVLVARSSALSLPALQALYTSAFVPANGALGSFKASGATVYLQIKAVAQKVSDGAHVDSNWFVLPVDICPGCAEAACQALSTATCTGSLDLESCLPYQGFGGCTVECT